MAEHRRFQILPQPDDTTCGPTCLQAVYSHYGDELPLEQVIRECTVLEEGGTLAVFLANHALRRGYRATIYTYNLQVFDPSWFDRPGTEIAERLEAQAAAKADPKLETATRAYLAFLQLGGRLRFEDLTPGLLRRYLKRGAPILTGVSATHLYREPREIGPKNLPDDVRGHPVGHFVVFCGYDQEKRQVWVADPLQTNPYSPEHTYAVEIYRALGAILLGVLTFDANFLVIEPRRGAQRSHADADRRQ